MAALAWQVDLVAGCVALRDDDPDVDQGRAAAVLKANPYPTGKALAIAARLDEAALRDLIEAVVAAEHGMKSGSDPSWRLEACVLEAARLMAGRRSSGAAGRRA
jgi:DNA polymerase III subunit delta